MTPILDHRHPAAAQSMPSRDPVAESGQGCMVSTNNTGAPIAVRTTKVNVTNPGMTAAARNGPAVREEGRRLTARTVDVSVRSGNNEPGQSVDARLRQPGFIWGLKGTGEPMAGMLEDKGLLLTLGVLGALAWWGWSRR